MCELMTIGAALVFTAAYFALRREPLLDFSREDLVLGIIVLGFGLAAHVVFLLIARARRAPAGYCAKAE